MRRFQYLVLASLCLVAPAFADIVYSCPDSSLCDGNTYAIWEVGSTSTSYTLEVDVQVTNDYTGSESDLLNALSIIPDNNLSFTSASLLSSPGDAYTYEAGGSNANGCDGTSTTFICAQGSPGAALFTSGTPNLLSFQFVINSTSQPQDGDTAHLKYLYVDTNGDKVGSLGSFDTAIQCIGDSTCGGGGGQSIVPEPSSLVLGGMGLLSLAFLKRRFRRG